MTLCICGNALFHILYFQEWWSSFKDDEASSQLRTNMRGGGEVHKQTDKKQTIQEETRTKTRTLSPSGLFLSLVSLSHPFAIWPVGLHPLCIRVGCPWWTQIHWDGLAEPPSSEPESPSNREREMQWTRGKEEKREGDEQQEWGCFPRVSNSNWISNRENMQRSSLSFSFNTIRQKNPLLVHSVLNVVNEDFSLTFLSSARWSWQICAREAGRASLGGSERNQPKRMRSEVREWKDDKAGEKKKRRNSGAQKGDERRIRQQRTEEQRINHEAKELNVRKVHATSEAKGGRVVLVKLITLTPHWPFSTASWATITAFGTTTPTHAVLKLLP